MLKGLYSMFVGKLLHGISPDFVYKSGMTSLLTFDSHRTDIKVTGQAQNLTGHR